MAEVALGYYLRFTILSKMNMSTIKPLVIQDRRHVCERRSLRTKNRCTRCAFSHIAAVNVEDSCQRHHQPSPEPAALSY